MSVFGALNRFISRLDADTPTETQKSSTRGAYGFQVLRNKNADIQIEPWFDFVIGINGRTIDSPDPNLFSTEVRNCAGNTISLGVWSAKGQRIRELYIPVPTDPPNLGLSLQWTPLAATEDVWHILEVTANSPADVAGLLPYGDYVIGSPEGLVRGESGLPELVEDYLERPLRLLVYNHEYNITRPVTITPSRNWGGQGALGCILGFGALHRIPAALDEPPQAPGETLFDTGIDEKQALAAPEPVATIASPPQGGDFLVPANLAFQRATGSPGPPVGAGSKAKKHRAHHNISPSKGFDDYFAEGEMKSKEQDHAPTSKSGAVPPPPKAGGPPKATPPVPTAEPAAEGDVD
ncbi:hypothetical protein NA57DRAFT_75534 [Rhizodiscina lignyota]|uniref:PDZ GRASP-type domain-containing protein n=1 Tax=Rhizodiscina lignyota TaxID=1504668 RepID=A0A9P4M6U2_9PEZI|nr:hypothetical protein NA57DRAFT_75534 [Rhizodiscina lignyota]